MAEGVAEIVSGTAGGTEVGPIKAPTGVKACGGS